LLKTLSSIVGLMLLLGIVGIIAVLLFFDVNDYRDDIEQAVEDNTGRDFVINGDISLSVFPWLEIEMPPVSLGNAAGFGDEPMVRIQEVDLSLKLLPLLFRREVQVSTARLTGLNLNLAVNDDGRSNWQDFIDAAEYRDSIPEEVQPAESRTPAATLEIAGVEILDSVIRYADASAGTDVTLSDLNIEVGAINNTDEVLKLDGFSINALLEGLSETPTVFGLSTTAVNINTSAEMIVLGDVELALLGLDISAAVEPFSFAGEITPTAAIKVEAFSLRNLMERMDIEPPETSDPAALGRVTMIAIAKVGTDAIRLTDLTLELDETTFTGSLAIPQGVNDVFELELNGDAIKLDGYMAPVTEGEAAATTADDAPVEIPAELIRLLNARGSMSLASAELSGMQFDDLELGVVMDDGKLRMHPIKASLFEGQYNGDVRIDASGATPVLSVNERIEGVQLGALAMAMFEQDNISGSINGSFELSGRGADMLAVQQTLGGDISMELNDGAFEGTDVWHELRKARALIRQEEAPEPTLPARTRFSDVSVSGPVNNGVFSSDNFQALLPFMQMTGTGSINFVEARVDYRMNARVFDKPELVGDEATAEELKDLAKVRIPIRITGPIAAPSVRPDTEKLLRDAAKKEVEDKLKDKLKDLLNR
ncbi:MAG: AsmA family protein, partial [Woeseiaceae bacterium]